MIYKHLSFLLIIGLLNTPIQAETLLELYQIAEQNDPERQIAYSEYLAILEKHPQARALLLPQVTLGADTTENWSSEERIFGNSRENTNIGYNVSLTYALYRRNLNIQLEQVNSQIQQALVTFEGAKQALMERIASRYFAVLAANDNLKFARSAKKAFRRQWDEAQQRFEVGLIAITDVQEAQAGYDLAVADEIAAQNDLDNAYEALREITGDYHQILAVLNEDAPLLGPEPSDLDAWTELALEQNPQLLAARYAVEIARQEIEKQRAANSPTLDLVGRHSYSDIIRGENNTFNSHTNSLSIQLNYPLYEGGAIRSRIKEAKIRSIQTLDKLEKQRRTVQSQTRQAFLSLLSNISRVKAFKQALISTETALKAIQTGFELGTRTSVDVVNAQRDLLRAQRNYSRTRYDYVLDTLQLKQATGLLSLDDLAGINNWLTQHTMKLQIDGE
ncbi:MAG: type I secretion protein TolC [Gammaproteobacteria bacterium]|nr:MAG: type I secretion protein TolC [Gammaproteobacteria bacterium]RKZ73610.1 MAG: type I secretion protein TolC [Gammaproteobacteria bacterium]